MQHIFQRQFAIEGVGNVLKSCVMCHLSLCVGFVEYNAKT